MCLKQSDYEYLLNSLGVTELFFHLPVFILSWCYVCQDQITCTVGVSRDNLRNIRVLAFSLNSIFMTLCMSHSNIKEVIPYIII